MMGPFPRTRPGRGVPWRAAGQAGTRTKSRRRRPVSSWGEQVMRPEEPGLGGPLGPLAALRKIFPFEPDAASDQLGWAGLEAARYRAAPDSELNPPGLTHDRLPLVFPPPA